MARTKFQTLTEQMFYILLSLKDECCGMDIMDKVKEMTDGRVLIGPARCTIFWGSLFMKGISLRPRLWGSARITFLQMKADQFFSWRPRGSRHK